MNVAPLFPVILLLVGGVGISSAGKGVGTTRPAVLSWLVALGAFLACCRLWGIRLSAFGLVSSDRPSQFLSLLVLVGIGGTLPLVRTSFLRRQVEDRLAPMMYGSALVAAAGGLLIVSTRNLGVMFLAMEVMWIGVRLFSVGQKGGKNPFTLMSGISSLTMLVGLVGLGTHTGYIDVASIEAALLSAGTHPGWIPTIALSLFILGLTLRMLAIQFDGGTRGASLALAATVQVAVVGAILRLTGWSLVLESSWKWLLGSLAVAFFCVGGFRLARGPTRRSWSYAQLGQLGAVLLGLTVGGEAGRSSALFYLVAFVFMSVGVIGAAVALGQDKESDLFSNGKDVARRHPAVTGAMGLLLLSLAGIPLTIGFWSRFGVYLAATHEGRFLILVFALLNMLAGFTYYLRPLAFMWMDPTSTSPKSLPVAIGVKLHVLISAGVVFGLGLAPEFLLSLTKRVALELF